MKDISDYKNHLLYPHTDASDANWLRPLDTKQWGAGSLSDTTASAIGFALYRLVATPKCHSPQWQAAATVRNSRT